MSKIVEKIFDASKKIVKSVFKGSPNLITTSDLNRQIDALKYQIDLLDDKTGIISDIDISHSLSSGTLVVKYNLTYFNFKGCLFEISDGSLDINFTSSAPIAYLCLVADVETITYDSDSTHDISGAKFVDGTSLPAANQVVYKNEHLVLTHSYSSLSNFVGIVAQFTLSNAGNVVTRLNVLKDRESLSISRGGEISDFNSSLIGKISNGTSYDEAFSILDNRFSNTVPEWDFLTYTDSSTGVSIEKDTEISFRIQNGILYLNIPDQKVQRKVTKMGGKLIKIGDFPSDKKTLILSLLKKMNFSTNNRFTGEDFSGAFIPYGEFGCFPICGSFSSATETEIYPFFGMVNVSLILLYKDSGSELQLADAFIGAYISGAIKFAQDNKNIQLLTPLVDWIDVTDNAYIYIPRIIGAIPLFGPA